MTRVCVDLDLIRCNYVCFVKFYKIHMEGLKHNKRKIINEKWHSFIYSSI